MIPSWFFQFSLITFLSTSLFIQTIAFPVERSVNDDNRNLESRTLRAIAKPLAGGAVLGVGAAFAYNHFTKSSDTIVAPAGSLNSLHGGPTGSPFASDSANAGLTDPSLDAGLDAPLKKRDLLGKNTSMSSLAVRDLYLSSRQKINRELALSFKRSVAAFGTIVAGSAVMNVFSGLFKGRRAAPTPEDRSDEQTESEGTSLNLDFMDSDIDEDFED